MKYYISKTIRGASFEEVIEKVETALKEEGFGVLTEIDVRQTLKKKIDVDFKKYVILGACNPKMAHQALQSEDKIGVLLPCNVIVVEQDKGEVEVSAVDPVASMAAVENDSLSDVALEVQSRLKKVVEGLK